MEDDRHTAAAGAPGPDRFPPGEALFEDQPFDPELFSRVDHLLAAGACEEGRLDLRAGDTRLTCLFHRGRPFLAGLLDGAGYSRVPLYEFPLRAAELHEPRCSLRRLDTALVLMAGVHFSKRPTLQASTRLVDPAHVLSVLESERQDATLAFARNGYRTLLFLHEGRPARVYFGEPAADPGEGTASDRFLFYAFDPQAPAGKVEVFTDLRLSNDPEEGTSLVELAESAKTPPAMRVTVHLHDGRELSDRPFTPPAMVIGRDPHVDVVIDNLAVSRRHARLLWERGEFLVEDLGSANGTLLNGRPVQRQAIASGDRVEIGKFRIQLEELPAAVSLSETMLLPTRKAPLKAALVGPDGAISLEHPVVIGKGRGVDATARGFGVRPVHARVERDGPLEFRLTCFGRAAVVVDGRKVRETPLEIGARFRVGRTEFRLSALP